MRKAQFFYLLRRGLLSGGLNLIKEGLVMASKFTTQGLSFPTTGSAEFNGTSDYVETSLTPADFPSSAFTFSAWANTDTITAFKTILGADTSISSTFASFYFQISNSGYWRLNVTNNSGAQYLAQDSVQAQANKWYYITGTFDGSNVKLYKDGSLVATKVFSGTLASVNSNTLIGASYFQDNIVDFWDGNLANVAIWNRALSSDEINSVMWKSYEGLTDSEENGLKAWYSLDDITSPAASLANMEQLATDKDATIENKAAITAAINALS